MGLFGKSAKELEDEGDKLFEEGRYKEAHKKYIETYQKYWGDKKAEDAKRISLKQIKCEEGLGEFEKVVRKYEANERWEDASRCYEKLRRFDIACDYYLKINKINDAYRCAINIFDSWSTNIDGKKEKLYTIAFAFYQNKEYEKSKELCLRLIPCKIEYEVIKPFIYLFLSIDQSISSYVDVFTLVDDVKSFLYDLIKNAPNELNNVLKDKDILRLPQGFNKAYIGYLHQNPELIREGIVEMRQDERAEPNLREDLILQSGKWLDRIKEEIENKYAKGIRIEDKSKKIWIRDSVIMRSNIGGNEEENG